MSLSTVITPAILDKIIGLLVPLFLSASGDLLTARHAASRLLADYDVETEEELRLAAEIIGFGFGALDALSKSMAADLTINAVLRLRGSANTQHRSANQCQRTLDKLRKERRMAAAELQARQSEPVAATEPTITGETLRLSDFIEARPDVSLSRQQRRAADRKAEKTQRKQAELARREAMRATRSTTAGPPTVPTPSHPSHQHLAA